MTSKYAMVWTTDRGYMPGTNATLNALEFYKFAPIDLFILTGGEILPKEYKDQWPNVKFIDMFNLSPSGKDGGWYYVYCDVIKAIELFDKGYDAILLWGADLCPLNDFSPYFEICEKTEAMILGTNEHGSHYLENLSVMWPYPHTWAVPYADVPFFVPKKWKPVLELMLKYNEMPDPKIDRMDGMNYAIRDLNAKVLPVPGELWVQNTPYQRKLEWGKNKTVYLSESSTFLYSFHRKYWNASICRDYLPGGKEPYSIFSRQNKLMFNQMYNFFNRECRVPWLESLEVWDGR